jgi:AraC family transcriptional regulator
MLPPIDRVLFSSKTVSIGAFRCPIDDPRFRDSGPAGAHQVVFPRRGVWIRQSGSAPLVADSGIATIYNRGRRYDRAPVSPDGDRSDWFAVAPEVAVAMARELDPGAPDDPEQAFRFEAAPVDHELYRRQRCLFLAVERGELEPLAVEERVLALVEAVLRRAAGRGCRAESRLSAARRDLVERARSELARDVTEASDLGHLAVKLGASPSHICRVFHQGTGRTLHQYRLELRLRAALERLADPGVDLSRLAAELGFSSHSHFTAVLRSTHGVTPSRYREMLAGRRKAPSAGGGLTAH